MPIEVLAYSTKIIPGGNSLGIKVNMDGIMVVGFYKVDGSFNKGTPEIKLGDYIIKINSEEVTSVKNMTEILERNVKNESVTLTIRRDKEIKNITLPLVYTEGKYKTGLYVKESITGIGTLTYIDPETKIYGALGHEILETNTESIVEIKTGSIFESNITGIQKSKVGLAGSKVATFDYDNIYGNIYKNTNHGIYGNYTGTIDDNNIMEITDDIKIGKAYIKTVVESDNIENFEIEITSVNKNSDIKNILFNITDERLLSKTGGVVQGMSGSPIIQDDKIIGAVTHVTVDNPINGYGLMIEKMLKEGEN